MLQLVLFLVTVQGSLDDTPQIRRFLTDLCDDVFHGIICFQSLRDGGEGNGREIRVLSQCKGGKFHRLLVPVDNVGRKMLLPDVLHHSLERMSQMNFLKVAQSIGGQSPVNARPVADLLGHQRADTGK